jgi:hypothetical protein
VVRMLHILQGGLEMVTGDFASYRNDHRILSVMIEVNRRIYMDEQSGLKEQTFEQTSDLIGKLIVAAAESVD